MTPIVVDARTLPGESRRYALNLICDESICEHMNTVGNACCVPKHAANVGENPVGTVKSRIRLAFRSLRGSLEPGLGEGLTD